jgi:hypothetical protein
MLLSSQPDLLIQVADAKNLRRTLLITAQLVEFGIPMVLVLNLMDEARNRNIEIDAAGLGALFGIPVISTVATDGEGFAAAESGHRAGDWAGEAADRIRLASSREWSWRVIRSVPGFRLGDGLPRHRHWSGCRRGSPAFASRSSTVSSSPMRYGPDRRRAALVALRAISHRLEEQRNSFP